MYLFLLLLYLFTAFVLIGLILLQQGKGAQAGAAFGGAASQTVFGSQGAGGFLSRATAVLATVFFSLAILLAYWIHKEHQPILPSQTPMPDLLKQEVVPNPAGGKEIPDIPQ